MLNRLSQQIRSIFSRPTRRRRSRFGYSERLEPRELLTTVVELVEDLNQQPAGFAFFPNEVVDANGLHFFTNHTIQHGTELWRTDGTSDGTIRLTDLNNDQEVRSSIRNLTVFQNRVFFTAQDVNNRTEIWVSDGTVSGTHLVADSTSSSQFSWISPELSASIEAIYFVAFQEGSGYQVYCMTDATSAPIAVTNFTAPEFFQPTRLLASGDHICFVRSTLSDGTEVWKAGESLVSPQLITTLSQISNMSDMVEVDGKLLFTESTGNTEHLWSIDPLGTITKLTIQPGESDISLSEGLKWGGEFLLPYSVFDGTSYVSGLWATDGTNEGSRIISDDGFASSLVQLGQEVFFLKDSRLWRTDGTASGTIQVGLDKNFGQLISNSDRLFLTESDGTFWVSDGTAERTQLVDLEATNVWFPARSSSLTDSGFLFWAGDRSHGFELWIASGSYSTAEMLQDLHPGTASASPTRLVAVDDDLFFTTSNGVSYRKQHGQPAATILPDGAWYTRHLTPAESTVYFVGQSDESTLYRTDLNEIRIIKSFPEGSVSDVLTYEDSAYVVVSSGPDAGLWHTNGSVSGTNKLTLASSPAVFLSAIDEVTGRLWFQADDGIHGSELWTSDGTVGGTHLVKDITAGTSNSYFNDIDAHNGLAYFTYAGQAWISDGTNTGTMRLTDVESALSIRSTHSVLARNDVVYMTVDSLNKGWQIIRTQGTPETSWFVTDLSVAGNAPPFNLTEFKGQLAFAALDADGLGVWVSNGLDSVRLKSFGANATIANWSIAGDALFFTILDQLTRTQEIWTTDGTTSGTRKLRQEAFDLLYVPRETTFVEYAGGIAFAAGTNEYGIEVVRIDTTIAPEAPANLRVIPRNGSPSNSIRVEWNEMPGANDYEIQVLSQTTQSIVVQQMLDSNQFDSETLPAGAYRVLVRGRSITGELSEWAQSASFAVGNPVMNSVATSASATRTFQWVSPLGTTSNEIWLTNRDAGTRVLYQTGVTGNSLATPSPLAPARYAVWVRSRLPGGQVSDWSAAVEFDVLAPAPTLISGSGTSNDGLPVISWTAVPGAASYQVQIHPVGSNTPLLSVSGLTATTYRVPQPMAGGRYLISIRAMKGTRQFAVPLLNQHLFVRRAPTGLQTVANGFSWSASPGALTYGYEIRNVRTNAVVMQGSQTSTIVQRSTAFPPGQYQARVFATYSGGVNTQWSTPLVFEEFRPALTITSAWTPTADATPSVTWNAGTDVTTYEVQAYRQGSGVIAYSGTGITTTSHRIGNALTAGTYVIQVRANYADGSRSVWSAVRTRVIGPAPVLTQTGRTTSWASITDATHYEFWVNYLGPNAPVTKAVYVPALAQTQFTLPSTLPKGRYQVWVRAIRAEAGELYAGLWGSTGAIEVL